jgi:hypothetical protein
LLLFSLLSRRAPILKTLTELTWLLALVLMSVCQTVGTYCAAQVLYWSGMNGIDYVFNVFIADTSLLQNRLLWIALTGAPYICNSFVRIKLHLGIDHPLTPHPHV